MISYPLQNIYNIERTVYLFNRDKNGNLYIKEDSSFSPYFYEEDSTGVYNTIDGKKVRKIYCKNPSEIKKRRSIKSYESDVLFTKRYIIDRISEFIVSPIKYLMIDIEVKTDSLPSYKNPSKPIVAIGLYNSITKEILQYNVSDYNCPSIEEREIQLLIDFMTYVRNEQPDILIGWNFVNFDYPYLYARIAEVLKTDFSRAISPIGKIRFGKKEIDIDYPAGISILDYLEMFKKIYRGESNYSLEYIAQKYLNIDLSYQVNYNEISEKLLEKNRMDVQRIVDLENKLKLFDYYDEIRRMSKCLWEDLLWNSRILDMMILSEAKKLSIILPSKTNNLEEEQDFEGAYRRCETGRFENLYKLDLSSAYPMAIINFCLDISNITNNINERKIDITDRETNSILHSIYVKQNTNALLPSVARKLIIKKDYLKNQLKTLNPSSSEYNDMKIKYDAIKSLVNSLFGVTALKSFRLYDIRISSAITSIIRDLLHYVEEKLLEKNIKVIYLDTDSLFVLADENPVELANQLIKQWAKEKYNKNDINIEFDYEGIFEKIFIVALCHYVGYLRTKDNKIKKEIKGIEIKRKDSSKFMQQFLNDLVEKILSNESQEKIVEFIRQQKEEIKKAKLIDIGFPCKLNIEKEYKSPPIFMRALKYTKELVNFDKSNGELFYYIYVEPMGADKRISRSCRTNKLTNTKEEIISETEIEKNVLAFDEKRYDHIKNIDWDKMIDRTIIEKAKHFFEAMNWKYDDL